MFEDLRTESLQALQDIGLRAMPSGGYPSESPKRTC
jgi:hypothetical protein